jgi:hypothetical protein
MQRPEPFVRRSFPPFSGVRVNDVLRLTPASPLALSQVNKRARPPSAAAIVLQPSAIPAPTQHSPNISLRPKSQSH